MTNVKRDELAFLVTMGTPINAVNIWQVAARSYTDGNGTNHYPYYQPFGNALESLGGVPISTLELFQAGSAYSFVSCPDCGNPLTGNSALSTTVYAQQGQTGYQHGIIQRSLNGLFWPTLYSQEIQGSGIASD